MRMKFREYKRYALVTGAASGMGRIYCKNLAVKGYNVVLVDINAAGLEETERIVKEAVQQSDKVPAEYKASLKLMRQIRYLR